MRETLDRHSPDMAKQCQKQDKLANADTKTQYRTRKVHKLWGTGRRSHSALMAFFQFEATVYLLYLFILFISYILRQRSIKAEPSIADPQALQYCSEVLSIFCVERTVFKLYTSKDFVALK